MSTQSPSRSARRFGGYGGVKRAFLIAVGVIGWTCQAGITRADDDTPTPQPVEDLHHVMALVDGVPILLGEIHQELETVLRRRWREAATDPRLMQEMLRQVIRRRSALAALVAQGHAASDQQVEHAWRTHRERFEQQGKSLESFLQQNGIAPESYRQRLRWELSWAEYKLALLTDENLRKFFERYRRHFDGTEVRASHILLGARRPRGGNLDLETQAAQAPSPNHGPRTSDSADDDAASNESTAQALARAIEIRDLIEAGEMSFAEAAAEFSEAPSRDRGGDIGFFPRQGVMHENFAAAAFRLDRGQISPPVQTPFGVHLILVTDQKQGSSDLADVYEAVLQAAESRLFDTLATAGREMIKVEEREFPPR